MLPIAREIARRGDRVVFYCSEALRPVIESTGAELRPVPFDLSRIEKDKSPSITLLAHEQLRCTEAWLPDLLRQLEALDPAYLLADTMCVWGRFAGRALGLPVALVSTSFAIGPGMMLPIPLILAIDIGASLSRLRTLAAFRRSAEHLAQRYGVPRLRLPTDIISMDGDLVLVTTSRLFQPSSHAFDERFQFIGPCFEPRRGQATDALPELDERPLIYVSLGTVFNKNAAFFKRCVEAFKDGRYQVVMAAGPHGDEGALGSLPRHIHVRRYVPQLDVLPRTSLFITHGGMNSTAEALSHAVPLAVSPQGADQHMIAARVEKLGVGAQVRPWHRPPAALRSLAERLMHDQAVRSRIEEVRRSFLEAGGPTRAADLLAEERWRSRGRRPKAESAI
jgi:MGT family glycosyltransferase